MFSQKITYNIKDKTTDSETASITEFWDSVQRVICLASRKPSRVRFLLPCCGCARVDELRRRAVTSARAPPVLAAPTGAPLSGLQADSCAEPRLVSPPLLSPAPSSCKVTCQRKTSESRLPVQFIMASSRGPYLLRNVGSAG